MMSWKPEGMSTVMPYITVADVEKSMTFYYEAFGFTASGVTIPGEDGTIWHSEMCYHDFTFMFGKQGVWSENYNDIKKMPKVPNQLDCGSPISLYVYCEDIQQTFEKAKNAGAIIVSEPEEMFWGDTMCGLKDIDGHIWNFATHTGNVTEPK